MLDIEDPKRVRAFVLRKNTLEEINEIIKLREQKLTYVKIGEQVGKTKQAISAIIRTHAPHLKGYRFYERKFIEKKCEYCLQTMKLFPSRSDTRFCSMKCSSANNAGDSYKKVHGALRLKYIEGKTWKQASEAFGYSSQTSIYIVSSRICRAAGLTRKQAAAKKTPEEILPQWRQTILKDRAEKGL